MMKVVFNTAAFVSVLLACCTVVSVVEASEPGGKSPAKDAKRAPPAHVDTRERDASDVEVPDSEVSGPGPGDSVGEARFARDGPTNESEDQRGGPSSPLFRRHAQLPDPDDTVVVTAARAPQRLADSAVAVEVIDRETILGSGADTLAQLLEQQPGMRVFQSFGGAMGIQMRGHDSDHVLILVDGRRQIGRVGGVIDLQRFTLDRVERVEIVRGPSSALYGSDALGGVIQIITRDGDQPVDGDITVQGGGYAADIASEARTPLGPTDSALQAIDHLALDASLGFSQRKVSGRTFLSMLGLDPWSFDSLSPGTVGNGFRQLTTGGRTSVDVSDAVRLTANLEYLQRDSFGTDATATGAVIDRLNRTETFDAALTTDWNPHERHTVQLIGSFGTFRDQYLQDQRGSDALDNYEVTREILGQVTGQWVGRVHDRHTTSAGVDVFLEDIEAARIDGRQANRERYAVFAQHEARLLDKTPLTLVPGFRLDVDSFFGVFPTPKLAVRFDPADAVTLRASGGFGYRAPNFRELFLFFENPGANYRVEGEPDLRPERSLGTTVDVDLRPHPLVLISVSGWHDQLTDLIQPVLRSDADPFTPSVFAYGNVARARVQGLSGQVQVSAAWIRAAVGYTLTDAVDLDEGRVLQGRAPHQGTASVNARWKRPGLGATVRANLVSARTFYAGDDPVQADAFLSLDAQLNWRAHDNLRVFAGLDNALDAGDRRFDPLRPRRVYAGVSANFAAKRKAKPAPVATDPSPSPTPNEPADAYGLGG